jgi:hypothetical protein
MIDRATKFLRRLVILVGAAAMPHVVDTAQAGLLDPPPPDAGHVCGIAVQAAEARYALPAQLLYAISEVESGRPTDGGSIRPWPWTVQAQNQSHYFETKAAAIRWVQQAQGEGITSIDVGCMQVNLMYHPTAFRNLDEAFDPMHNADYAARFLIALHAEAGDWRLAAGQYHSQTLALAIPYRQRVEAMLAGDAAASPSLQDSPLLRLQAAWEETLQSGVGAAKPAELTGNWSGLLRRAAARTAQRRRRYEPIMLSDAH